MNKSLTSIKDETANNYYMMSDIYFAFAVFSVLIRHHQLQNILIQFI